MAYTKGGKRHAFDNIAVGSATGVERTIAGGGGEYTTVFGGRKEGHKKPDGTSGYTSAREKEFLTRTVSGGQVSDRTTDRDPGY